jgi:acetolactate synthase-1/2/3 large subunit
MKAKQVPTGASLAVDALVDAGVDTVFAITGAGNLAFLDEISFRQSIQVYFLHHEQAVVMAAQGYARTSGKIGVAVVTTGGGTSNAMTGILSAHLDSTPVLIVSGNESSFHCESNHHLRAFGVQGFDSVECFRRITKKSQRIQKDECPYISMSSLMELAISDRMGPVHIDFPMDLQRSAACPKGCSHERIGALKERSEVHKSSVSQLLKAIRSASRPILYIGNGCRRSDTLEEIQQFVSLTNIPFFLSWSAIDLFADNHPGNFGRIGIYGERSSNLILQKADLVVCIGTRLAIPQVGYDKNDFARNAEVWVVDVDPTELEKFSNLNWQLVNTDACIVIKHLKDELSNHKESIPHKIRPWLESIVSIRDRFDKFASDEIGPRSSQFVHSIDFIRYLNQVLNDDAIVVTDVGAGLLSGHYAYAQQGSRRLFTSQGLGEMGFGLPAAIGAFFAAPSKQIVCLNTDGAIMFNLQELQTVRHFNIPLKLVVFNNEGYAMIKISQNNLFEGRVFGSSTKTGISFPSFHEVAKAFGLQYFRVAKDEDLGSRLLELLTSQEPVLIEVIMDPEQKYYPRLATSRDSLGHLVSPPIEDLDPKVSMEVLMEILEGSVHESSRQIER